MNAPLSFDYFSSPSYVPLIIDAWKPDLWRIEEFCRFNQYVFLGSLEAVQELTLRGMKNVHYLPVSISKKHHCLSYPEKDIDLFIYGRNHFRMYEWIDRLWNTKSLHIVNCTKDKEGNAIVRSNKKGNLGNLAERDDLMNLLRRSRYTAVSSTGNDLQNSHNLQLTGGFSPVTPRFLEAAVNYSQGVGIYPDNPDFRYFDMEKVAINVHGFDAFEQTVRTEINGADLKERFDSFLNRHWCECRVAEIVRVLAKQ